MRPQRSGPPRGFTLLELLVGLAVLSLLLLGLGRGTQLGLGAWNRQEQHVHERAELDAVDRILRQLVARIDPGPGGQPAAFEGESSRLSFTAPLPMAAAATSETGNPRGDVVLVVKNRALVLDWALHRHEKRAAPPSESATLLSGVDSLEIAYWAGPAAAQAGGQSDGGWQSSWSEPVLPGLIRFRLRFPAGDQRHWPDIIVAPLLEPSAG